MLSGSTPLYDPDVSFPILRQTLAFVAERCQRPCPLPARPTVDALGRMTTAETELSDLTMRERVLLAHCGGVDYSAEEDDRVAPELDRVEDAAPVAHLLLDDVFENPETLENPE